MIGEQSRGSIENINNYTKLAPLFIKGVRGIFSFKSLPNSIASTQKQQGLKFKYRGSTAADKYSPKPMDY